MKKTGVIIIVLIFIAVGIIVWMSKNNKTENVSSSVKSNTSTTTNTSPANDVKNIPVTVGIGENVRMGGIKEFTVNGQDFSFNPKTITVNKGDTVNITFNNLEDTHNLKIDEFSVATANITGGQSATVKFVASKAGSFEYYCSVGKHRELGMRGALIVK